MYSSLEVRWFYPGELPDDIRQWHEKGGAPREEDPRTDSYLRGTGAMLGIKLREGLVEIKQQQKDFGEVNFEKNLSGRAQSWVKWSFPNEKPLGDADEYHSHWMAVEKKRWIKLFLLDAPFIQAPVNEYPTQGCIWEISQVYVGRLDETWWSVCFEMFGPDGGEIKILKSLVDKVIESGNGIQLEAIDSYGYPTWLDKING